MGKPHSRAHLVPRGSVLLPSNREGKQPAGRGKCPKVAAPLYSLGGSQGLENQVHLPGGDLGVPELSWVHFIPESPFSEGIS